jgi:hypothetical protein
MMGRHTSLIMTWLGMMESQGANLSIFVFCYFRPWPYSFFFCVAAFGEQGDEGDDATQGVQLPEADGEQGDEGDASTGV